MPFPNLTGRAIKATMILDGAEVAEAAQQIQTATGRVVLRIAVAGRTIAADVASKSLRKCLLIVQETGVDGVAVILTGKLQGDTLSEAGIVAQVKAPKVAAA